MNRRTSKQLKYCAAPSSGLYIYIYIYDKNTECPKKMYTHKVNIQYYNVFHLFWDTLYVYIYVCVCVCVCVCVNENQFRMHVL
jgi:hypothetical protein